MHVTENTAEYFLAITSQQGRKRKREKQVHTET